MALVRDLGTAVISKTAAEEVARLVSFTGLEHRYVWGLPSVYRGFINSTVIERARVNGRYFNSVTPDAYSAFVNSFFLERYLYLETPLTIEGVSGKSNGASQNIWQRQQGGGSIPEGKMIFPFMMPWFMHPVLRSYWPKPICRRENCSLSTALAMTLTSLECAPPR